jgi:N-methylhydantoinase A
MVRVQLGVDIGGTFTDFVAVVDDGTVFTGKTLTTPSDPARAVQSGLHVLLQENQIDAKSIDVVIHATTLITNAIIERKGARIGLITTAGFRDLLEIGREVRYDLYDLFLRMPRPLVPRALRLEVRERIDSSGNVVQPLNVDDVRNAAVEFVASGVEAIAIGFLHSYLNDEHERAAADLIRGEFPDLMVSTSAAVAREIREYERFSTTAANAYVQPLAGRYLKRLADHLNESGIEGPLHIMLSNGGVATADVAASLPVRLIESGPAAGALAAGHTGKSTGESHILGFDMGGTTAKLCLVEDGEPAVTYSLDVAREHRFKRGSGLPIRAPSVELIEIGAGGGSIARIDELGLLTVGPESAGSEPGPACYRFGGVEPTVTDADLVLGYLNPDYFLGGEMRLDPVAARCALDSGLAKSLNLEVERVAWGIHDMVNENMATAAGVYIAEKGRDPRRYAMVATGGAGPVHAIDVARKIGLSKVIVPPSAGVASAAGLLVAPPRMDFAHSYPARLTDVDWDEVNRILRELEEAGRSALRQSGVSDEQMAIERIVELRYVNQGHEVPVPLPEAELGPARVDKILSSFEAEYISRFNRTIPGVPVESLTWRVTVLGPVPDTGAAPASDDQRASPPVASSARPVYSPATGEFIPVQVYRRDSLTSGAELVGPAIIEEIASTTVIGQNDVVSVDRWTNLIITLGGGTPIARKTKEG